MALLGMLTGLSQQALRAFLDIRYLVLVSSFLQLALKVAIAMALIWLGWALMGYLVAVVVSSALAVAGLVWGLRGHIQRLERTQEEISPETRKTWLAYSRTMYANSLLGVVGAPVERFLLAGMINLASVGILMAVRQLQSFPQVLLQVIIMVIAPMFVDAKTRGDMDEVKHLYHIATNWVCRLGFPLLVFLFVFGDELLGLYGAAFSEIGHLPLLVLVAGQFVNLSMGPLGNMLNMVDYENEMFRLNMISTGMGYLLLLVLVPNLGLLGVALASTFSMLFLNVTALRIMRVKLGISWWSARHQRLLVPLAAAFALALLADVLRLAQGAWTLVMVLAATYGVFFLIYLSGGLSQEDKEVYSMLRVRLGLGK
jgi:O-antigen/teichoic acid export membrane protein